MKSEEIKAMQELRVAVSLLTDEISRFNAAIPYVKEKIKRDEAIQLQHQHKKEVIEEAGKAGEKLKKLGL